ncbi:MAG: RagB/SusD family nutrient uptake outer membrane protein [Paludibacteraceae bacterium]|nr:RagB/SusD family nutrient uptake outer membrane protein [Paludibacteraceae bacterium]
MKRITILTSAALALLLTACNLDYFPQDEVTSEMLAQNYEGLRAMTDGNYSMLKADMEYRGTSTTSYTFCRRGLEMAEYSSDELIISGRTTSTIFQAYTYERNDALQNVSYVWWCLYKCIYGANMVIEAIEDGESAQKDYLKGENYFLRAFCHLYLCNLYAWPYSYGRNNPGVVLRTSTNTSTTTRATVGEVYDQIVKDLNDAIRLMSGGTRRGDNSYANLEAAQGLLSRVYLHMEKNDKVIALVGEMLGSADPASKLMTTAEYPTYFANTKTAHETLWCIGYTTLDGGVLGQSLYAGMLLNDGIGWGEAYPSDAQLDLYQRFPEDLRYTAYIKPQLTGDQSTWVARYAVTNEDNRLARSNYAIEATMNGDGSVSFVDAKGNSVTAHEEIVNASKQYFATIDGEKTRVYVHHPMITRNTFPNWYVTKFSYQDGMPMLGSPSMVRWAEIILNRAEAYAKTGQDAKALDDVNVIRKRAGLTGDALMTAANMAERGYSSTLDVVLDERRLELAFEGFRTLDVFRNKRSLDRRFPGIHTWEVIDCHDPKILYPIPFDEISVSGIQQNEGY